MLAGTKDHPVARILVYIQKSSRGPDPNTFGSMVNNLFNFIIRQMKSKKGGCSR
jgi:hypothetical protein